MSETANIRIDEAALIKRCRKGDTDAAETLMLRYQNRIYNTILKICANTHDAAELTQETFVKVIENIGNFQARSGFYTWVFRIAVNLTLSYCKRGSKLGLTSLDTDYESDSRAGGALRDFLYDNSSPDPAAVAQNNELCRLVMKALMKLDQFHRTIIVLRDIEGMNYSQIAKVLDIELGTAKSRLSRARANLREIMEAML